MSQEHDKVVPLTGAVCVYTQPSQGLATQHVKHEEGQKPQEPASLPEELLTLGGL